MTDHLMEFASSLPDSDPETRDDAVAVLERRAETALPELRAAASEQVETGDGAAVRTWYELSWVVPGALATVLLDLADAFEDAERRPYAAGAFANVAEDVDSGRRSDDSDDIWDAPITSLTDQLHKGDEHEQGRALRAVERLARNNPQSVCDAQPVLWDLVERADGDIELPLEALYHVTSECDPDGNKPALLERFLDHDNPRVRALALGTLANLAYTAGESGTLETILGASAAGLADEDPMVRRFASQVLEATHPDGWLDRLGPEPSEEVVEFTQVALFHRCDSEETVARRFEHAVPDIARYYPFPFVPVAETDPELETDPKLVRSVTDDLREALDSWEPQSERAAWAALEAIDAVPESYDGPPEPEEPDRTADTPSDTATSTGTETVEPADSNSEEDSTDNDRDEETEPVENGQSRLFDWFPF